MSYPQANQAYTEAAVLSASPEQLIVMLYDGCLRFLQQAAVALEANNREIARKRLLRAEAVINELNQSLNMEQGGEIAGQLRAIYLYCKRQMMQALIDGDAALIQDISTQLRELRGAWAQAATNVTAA